MVDEIGKRPPNLRRWRLSKIIGKIEPDIPNAENLIRGEMLKWRWPLAVAFVDYRGFTNLL
jgi:hypothetical protein